MGRLIIVVLGLSLYPLSQLKAEQQVLSVTDYSGTEVILKSPAKKILALSPHIVENIFSAGAGEKLIAAVEYSDFPSAAKDIEKVGSNNVLNVERIVALQPDLIVAWQSGNSRSSIEQLKRLGFQLYIDEPRSLEDIARSIKDIGTLAGTLDSASIAAQSYLSRLKQLTEQFASAEKVDVFYQVWNKPLQTLNGQHLISQAIERCGGYNIFSDETAIAPVINIESVLENDPLVILASGISGTRPEWLEQWKRWPQMTAVKKNHLFFVPADHVQRHTLRILLGIETICQQLRTARSN